MQKIAFIIPPTVELLDLSGPAQVFTEAKVYGMEVEMEFYQYSENPISTRARTARTARTLLIR